MPKQANESSMVRQWEMLKHIPRKLPGITAGALAEKMESLGFPVSKRTVERDLRDLSNIFPLASNEDSAPFRWYFSRDVSDEFGGCELAEAVSLHLAEDALMSMLPQAFIRCLSKKFETARKKLLEVQNLPIAKWSSMMRYAPDTYPFRPVNIRADVLDKIQTALIENRKIEAKYDATGKPTSTRVLNPLGIVNMGARAYLIATLDGYENPIKLALQRFRGVKLLEDKIETPKGFNLDKYIESGAMQFGEAKEIKLQAILSEDLAGYLEETPLSSDQKINWKEDKYILTATVKKTWQLILWIHSQGSGITVQSPKTLRDDIIADIEENLRNYKNK